MKSSESLHNPAAFVLLFTPGGSFWLQKRSHSKKMFPGVWDMSAGGSIEAGETPLEAIVRETKEEIGLDIAPTYVGHARTSANGGAHPSPHLFTATTEDTPSPQDHEVDAVQLWTMPHFLQSLADKPQDFVPTLVEEIALCLTASKKSSEG